MPVAMETMHTHEAMQTRALGPPDLPAIIALERASWATGLQADARLIEQRFALGHQMVGAWADGHLRAMTSFSYTWFDPRHPETLPRTFVEFSSRPVPARFNTAFGYNLNVHPAERGGRLVRRLLQAALGHASAAGCAYLVGDGRCPSYNGSHDPPADDVAPNPEFRQAIDEFMRTGVFPEERKLLLDPTLRLFSRLMHCRFIAIIPDFLPADTASGGFQVMYLRDMR